jgi:hypothetical protein
MIATTAMKEPIRLHSGTNWYAQAAAKSNGFIRDPSLEADISISPTALMTIFAAENLHRGNEINGWGVVSDFVLDWIAIIAAGDGASVKSSAEDMAWCQEKLFMESGRGVNTQFHTHPYPLTSFFSPTDETAYFDIVDSYIDVVDSGEFWAVNAGKALTQWTTRRYVWKSKSVVYNNGTLVLGGAKFSVAPIASTTYYSTPASNYQSKGGYIASQPIPAPTQATQLTLAQQPAAKQSKKDKKKDADSTFHRICKEIINGDNRAAIVQLITEHDNSFNGIQSYVVAELARSYWKDYDGPFVLPESGYTISEAISMMNKAYGTAEILRQLAQLDHRLIRELAYLADIEEDYSTNLEELTPSTVKMLSLLLHDLQTEYYDVEIAFGLLLAEELGDKKSLRYYVDVANSIGSFWLFVDIASIPEIEYLVDYGDETRMKDCRLFPLVVSVANAFVETGLIPVWHKGLDLYAIEDYAYNTGLDELSTEIVLKNVTACNIDATANRVDEITARSSTWDADELRTFLDAFAKMDYSSVEDFVVQAASCENIRVSSLASWTLAGCRFMWLFWQDGKNPGRVAEFLEYYNLLDMYDSMVEELGLNEPVTTITVSAKH